MPVPARTPWWESRGFALAAMLLAAVPLLIPAVPPLTDVPGHIGRYHIAAHLAGSPLLARHWQFEWGLIGNLGVDLIVEALAPLIPAPLAAKLVIVAIPPLWVWGLIRLSRASGTGADAGRLAPGAALGFPLVYSWPFQFGFVNFMLSATLALHALASWIAMGRAGRVRQRAALFVPVSWVLWIAHSFGWGLFGLIAFAAELAERRRLAACARGRDAVGGAARLAGGGDARRRAAWRRAGRRMDRDGEARLVPLAAARALAGL